MIALWSGHTPEYKIPIFTFCYSKDRSAFKRLKGIPIIINMSYFKLDRASNTLKPMTIVIPEEML